MKYTKYISVLIIFAIITTLCCAQTITTVEKHEFNAEEAKQNLKEFLSSIKEMKSYGDLNIIKVDEFNTPSGDYFQFEAEEGSFKVNKNTGTVESLFFYSDESEIRSEDLSKDESLKIAEEFALKHYSNFKNMNMELTNSEKLEGNYDKTRYLFSWYEIQRSASGLKVYMPNYVTIAVEGGEIIGYIGIERDTQISLDPNLSEDTAIEIGTETIGIPTNDIKTAKYDNKLAVSYYEGRQHLTWVINVDNGKDSWGYAWGGQAIIDAQTGEVLMENPYL
ncbi:hypothetical protein [Methanoplanus limicola]|uniref:Uncharacterized protein n=1 Tax=Methanoplanus limicola DSM 2279 TaxID=937775 RepID=H1Z4M1_9EURY|nr:hypothetical protein [Methanoplanus limicola]EHQ36769.1 hypothetical protein Metlim_2734 [Methanoplanus limicola DSM 2279]